MGLALQILLVFGISVIMLYVVVKLFGDSTADLKTVAVAAVLITVISFVLDFVPFVGWILASIVNIIIVVNVMDCSIYVAFFAILIWRGLTLLAVVHLLPAVA